MNVLVALGCLLILATVAAGGWFIGWNMGFNDGFREGLHYWEEKGHET